ncbi:MAG: hypothetical protein P4L16_04930 [Chlamydiales bacterium]|nr:hypothetical protein [Chlamydiales bacterium]
MSFAICLNSCEIQLSRSALEDQCKMLTSKKKKDPDTCVWKGTNIPYVSNETIEFIKQLVPQVEKKKNKSLYSLFYKALKTYSELDPKNTYLQLPQGVVTDKLLLKRTLTLQNMESLSPTDLGEILSKFSNIRNINAANCKWLTDNHLKVISCFPITGLSFHKCPQISDKSLECFKDMPIISLSLAYCSRITDKGLFFLQNMQLQRLDLTFCYAITNKGLFYLRNKPFTHLILKFLPCITDDGFFCLNTNEIKILNIRKCHKLTDKTFEKLKDSPLHDLEFSKSDLITKNSYKHIADNLLRVIDPASHLCKDGYLYFSRLSSCSISLFKLILAAFPNILKFDFTDCEWLTDEYLEDLKDLSVEVLILINCINIKGEAFAFFKNTPLKILSLDGCIQLSKSIFLQININSLRMLSLERCNQFIDEDLEFLQQTTQLEFISLLGCTQVSDKTLSYFHAHTSLESADFSGCNITDKGLANIVNSPLYSLSIVECIRVKGTFLKDLRKEHLKSLSLDNCRLIDDQALQNLSEMELEQLYLPGCDSVTTVGLLSLNVNFLQRISLDWCNGIDGQALDHLKEAKNLMYLSLSNLNFLNDNHLRVVENFSSLEWLRLNDCHQVKGEFFKLLPKSLQYLSINCCSGIDKSNIANLQELQLETLCIKGCTQLTDECIESLKFVPLRHFLCSESGITQKTKILLNKTYGIITE